MTEELAPLTDHEELVDLVLCATARGYATGWERTRATILIHRGATVKVTSTYMSALGIGRKEGRLVSVREHYVMLVMRDAVDGTRQRVRLELRDVSGVM